MLVAQPVVGVWALSNYRLYRLDGAGKITNAEWIDALSDEEAIGHARDRADTGSFELWQKDRLIERFRPSNPPQQT